MFGSKIGREMLRGNFMAAKLGGLNIVRPKQKEGQNAKNPVFRPATGRNTYESARRPHEKVQPLARAWAEEVSAGS